MTLVLDTTYQGESSNSYATQGEATAYFAANLAFNPLWTAMAAQEQIARLIQAARTMDRLRFLGTKAYAYQALQFPRSIDINTEQARLKTTNAAIVDPKVKEAQFETVIACYNLSDALKGETERGISSVDLSGVVSVTFDPKEPTSGVFGGSLDTVKALLAPWLEGNNSFAWTK